MEFIPSWYILPAAFILDLLLGDPSFLPHPVRWMGKAISIFEPCFRKLSKRLFTSGLFFSLFLISASFAISFFVVYLSRSIHPVFGSAVEILLIYYSISVRSLRESAIGVMNAFQNTGISGARKTVSMIVGRDTENLSEEGAIRASVETVAENLVDGVISPVFFAAIGGAPLAMAYKMINTLDSMVGYKNDKYIDFGKASARIDDAANFIPSRISVLVISTAAQIMWGKGMQAFKTAVREGSNHASPNSGYSEAAFAGALGVKFGGPNYYNGQLVSKPFIGSDFGRAEWIHIHKACNLMVLSSLITFFLLWSVVSLFKYIL